MGIVEWTSVASNIANLFLAVIAFKGLEQLRIAKQDIRLRSMREAATLAATQCERFANEFVPRGSGTRTRADKLGFPRYTGPRSFVAMELSDLEPWLAVIRKPEAKGFPEEVVACLNILEAIAIYFEKGIADEAIAYPSLARPLCDYVEQFYPILAFYRPATGQKLYENLTGLYLRWKPRLEKTKLEDEKRALQQRIGALPPASSIRPMGAE